MYVDVASGQQEARARWGTQASGEAFDRKKSTFLTDEAREFISQQVVCVIVGPGPGQLPGALLLTGRPGFVALPDAYTCSIPIDRRYEESSCVRGLRAALAAGNVPRLALCFVQHVTRQRICVQGRVDGVSTDSSGFLQVHLQVDQAFFHCSKYLRTRVAGLHQPVEDPPVMLNGQEHNRLTTEYSAFLARQILCYVCTVDYHGQHAINHRGGAAGFLVVLAPDRLTPGGVVLLPDYAGNGAFEAVGNLLETGKIALLVPGYAEQAALCVAGEATILEPGELPAFLREKCRGAQRIVAIIVKHVEVQEGDWSEALAYERARAKVLSEVKQAACSSQG